MNATRTALRTIVRFYRMPATSILSATFAFAAALRLAFLLDGKVGAEFTQDVATIGVLVVLAWVNLGLWAIREHRASKVATA